MKQLEKSAKQAINAAQISAYLRVKFLVLVIMNISGAGVGGGLGGPCLPLEFETFSKKGCFLNFQWEKT